jgi:hypothetical protein
MFNKRKETFLTATQSYATEMIRATLKEMLKTDVYLMQININPPDVLKAVPSKVLASRSYANAFLVMDVKAYFTSLDRPRPRGREGVYPLIPSVNASLRFTSETNGFRSWELFDIGVVVENFDTEEGSGYMDHMTFETPCEGDMYHDYAPEHLRMLSKELHLRAPRWPEKQ